ncbi:kinase-like domain-containing protein [Corynascus novoguineensis]|uniref:Kinase-like domain-containing protein n=1 Tax=Corynascus novoguineensis TaxID=1126955 RepID=A0AAN7CRR0_9PEZI|nr:kinase-like domain-containing protein [Corynascus novoguineensis]
MPRYHRRLIPTRPPAGFSFDRAEVIYQHADRVVWKIGHKYILKRTGFVNDAEAATHRFVWENTHIPLPKLYGEWVLPVSGRRGSQGRYRYYLLEERIPGQTLKDCWGQLSARNRVAIAEQVAGLMEELARFRGRRMETVSGARLPNNCFNPAPDNPRGWLTGRWATDDDVFNGVFLPALLRRGLSDTVIRLCRCTMPPCEGELAFTHGDLYVGNVLVDPVTARVTGLIDWEMAGFWPEWFQYARITHGCSRDDDEWKAILSRASRRRIRRADHGRVWHDAVTTLLYEPGSAQARAWLRLLLQYQRGQVDRDALRGYRGINESDVRGQLAMYDDITLNNPGGFGD